MKHFSGRKFELETLETSDDAYIGWYYPDQPSERAGALESMGQDDHYGALTIIEQHIHS